MPYTTIFPGITIPMNVFGRFSILYAVILFVYNDDLEIAMSFKNEKQSFHSPITI